MKSQSGLHLEVSQLCGIMVYIMSVCRPWERESL